MTAKRMGIYLCEQDGEIGPFRTRQDAERFLVLVESLGMNIEGIEIVELSFPDVPPMEKQTFPITRVDEDNSLLKWPEPQGSGTRQTSRESTCASQVIAVHLPSPPD